MFNRDKYNVVIMQKILRVTRLLVNDRHILPPPRRERVLMERKLVLVTIDDKNFGAMHSHRVRNVHLYRGFLIER